jgi:ribosomal-protein-alanine N-acetyltransferase
MGCASLGGEITGVEPTQTAGPDLKIHDPISEVPLAESGLQSARNNSACVRLYPLHNTDAAETSEMLARSADFHRDWVTYPTSLDQVAAFIARSADDGMLILGIRRPSDNILVGIVTLCRIAREPWLTAECGAAVDVRHRGKGYMAEGMRLLVRFAIDELGLHRVEALVRPENVRSAYMLTSAGFRIEGIARGAVRIQDSWVDHVRWAITAEDLAIIRRDALVEERG